MKWEIFNDASCYNLWAVRPIGDKDFNSQRLFHFAKEEEAKTFKLAAEKEFSKKEDRENEVEIEYRMMDVCNAYLCCDVIKCKDCIFNNTRFEENKEAFLKWEKKNEQGN